MTADCQNVRQFFYFLKSANIASVRTLRPKGRLAQLVERYIDVVNVRGSNPLPPTRKTPQGAFFVGINHL